MPRRRPASVPTWMLFAIPAVLAVAIIGAILLGGPALGFLAALTAAVVILVVAIRMEPGRKSQAPAKGGDPRGARRRRAAALRFLVPIAIVVAGTIVILVGDRTARIIGWGVLAVGVTI